MEDRPDMVEGHFRVKTVLKLTEVHVTWQDTLQKTL